MKNDDFSIGCLLTIIAIVVQILIFVIPPIYRYVINDITNGNCLILLIVFAVIDIIIILHYYNIEEKTKKDLEHKYYQEQNELERKYRKKEKELELNIQEREQLANRRLSLVKQLLDGNKLFQKVPTMYADAKTIVYEDYKDYLINKSHPAKTAAEIVQATKKKLQATTEQLQIMKYKYEFLLNQFPQLRYYVDDYEELQEALNDISLDDVDYDRVRDWISKEEYEKLSVDDRNQLALDKWKNRTKKTNTQIGYEYELYVGYMYRREGWQVEQYGIDRGLEDLGRDIIATKYDKNTGKTKIHIVQCKYWSQRKEVHENVVNQLYGTMMMYKILHDRDNLFKDLTEIKAVLVSSTKLSDTATKFADILGVEVAVQPMGDFPRIKCNVNKSTEEKIYHLPFDQQYYKAKIEDEGEFYAWTVKEAVNAGFRRAFKYRGTEKN